MIAQVVRLARWEWFKLRKRWIPWILLAIVVVVAQSFLWSSYISYETTEIGGGYSLPGPGEREGVGPEPGRGGPDHRGSRREPCDIRM